MTGDPCNRDAAAYILQHFVGEFPEYYDAKINPTVPIKELPCKENLIAYFPFEGDVNPAVGDFAGKDGILPHAFVTDGSNSQIPTAGDLGRIALLVGSYQFLQNAHFFMLSDFTLTIIQDDMGFSPPLLHCL